jgi:hypothetical protein
MPIRRLAAALMLGSMLVSGAAEAATGSGGDPIVVRMRRGTDRIRLHGVLKEGVDCCTYKFDARKGQHLTAGVNGPATRLSITFPNGDGDGPALPDSMELPETGTYLLTVSPNLMADGAYGRFTLYLAITK